jgi:hypothetical protein
MGGIDDFVFTAYVGLLDARVGGEAPRAGLENAKGDPLS